MVASLSRAPGLGVELDEDVARAHPYEGAGLHLEVTENGDNRTV